MIIVTTGERQDFWYGQKEGIIGGENQSQTEKETRMRSKVDERCDALMEGAISNTRKWRRENVKATFNEIEGVVDQEMARVRAQLIKELVRESEMVDIKRLKPEERPRCPTCGKGLVSWRQHKRTLTTQHEHEIELERSYAYCKDCQEGVIPLG